MPLTDHKPNNLTNHVAARRAAIGLSQAKLAEVSGLSRAEVSAIETGRVVPSVAGALALARAFGCRVEDVFRTANTSEVSEVVTASGEPLTNGARYWLAEVGDRRVAYPVEATAVGTISHDGCAGDDGTGAGLGEKSSPPDKTLVIAGCDPCSGVLAEELARHSDVRLIPLMRSSGEALELLKRGVVHCAGLHYTDEAGESANAKRVAERLGPGYRLIRMADWDTGVAYNAAHHRKASFASLVRHESSWAPREQGSVARESLERMLGRRAERLMASRPVSRSHRAVADVIRSGWANAGVCLRYTALEAGLSFIQHQRESYDFCVPESMVGDSRILALLSALRSRRLRTVIGELPGYGSANTGEVVDAI